ncbi:MAG: hypothetical protein JWM05_1498 [Acidimicrobiales bacterium]|nr:hypothetical protein [Acidimicrobiales bacterium]
MVPRRSARMMLRRSQALNELIRSLAGGTEGEVRSALATQAPWCELTNVEVAAIVQRDEVADHRRALTCPPSCPCSNLHVPDGPTLATPAA